VLLPPLVPLLVPLLLLPLHICARSLSLVLWSDGESM
jgi:hypothetical protein